MARLASVLALCAGGAVAMAQQVVYTYTGPLDGDWNTAGNWNPVSVPGTGPSDVAIIPAGSRARYVLTGAGGRTIDKLEVGAGGQLEMRNNNSLSVRGQTDGAGMTGLLTIPGTLLMSSAGNITDLFIVGGTFVTFGGGAPSTPALIEMGNSSQNRILGAIGNERLDIQPAATIRGAGQIGVNQLAIVNEGTIEARGGGGMVVDPNGSGLTNTGVLRADTGTLTLLNGSINNTDGQIIANAEDVVLTNSVVTGGTLETTGGAGVVRTGIGGGGTAIHDLTNLGVFRIPNNLGIATSGSIINNGTIEFRSAGNLTDMYVTEDLTFSGSGSVDMNNRLPNRVLDSAGYRGFVVTNVGPHTIIGSGQLGVNTLDIVNQSGASILARGSGTLNIDPGATVTNLGTFGAVDGGKLFLSSGTFIMTAPAIAQDGGEIYLNGGSFTGTFGSEGTGVCYINTAGGSTILTNLTNTGQLNLPNNLNATATGTLTNNGTISMLSAGNLTDIYLGSDLTLNGSGTLGTSNSTQNRILDAAGNRGFVLRNSSTINGAAQIGLNTIDVINQAAGVIEASGSAGILFDPATFLVNEGAIRAGAGSTVEFRAATYTFTTPVTALNGGRVAFNGGTFSGRVTTEGTGVCEVVSAGSSTAFSNLINLGRIDLLNNRGVVWLNTIDNRGTFNMASAGNATDVYINSNVSLVGGGTISMSNNLANNIYDNAGNRGFIFTNVSNTITGAGRIGLNTLAIVNEPAGSIIATLSQGIDFDPASTFTNNGVLRAETGSLLRFLAGTYQFNAPAIAGDGGLVFLNAGTFSGVVDSEGTGEVRAGGFTTSALLTDFTNLGTLALPNDLDFSITGSIVNHGTIAMRSGGNATDFLVVGNATLSGTGSVTMSNNAQNNFYDAAGNRGFTFTIAQPIVGAGRIGINTINIVNSPQGRIESTSSAGISIDASTTFANEGELRASGGNIGVQPAAFTNTGSIIADAGRLIQFTGTTLLQTAGVTIANGEVQVDNDIFNLQGGLIIGSGRVDSTVNNTAGLVSPGNSTNDTPSFAVLTIEGNFNQSETGETLIELGGPTLGTEYDRVAVTGVANTGGVLRIRLVDGYSPVLGTTYDIITAASIAGGYDTIVAENIPFNNQLSLSILSDRIRVVFDIRCLGDYDGDGGITGADIAAFFEDFEAGSAAADLDQDGGITGSDIGEFFARFEAGC
jgi:hypothetical protein